MDESSPEKFDLWQRRLQIVRTGARRVAPFLSGVAAAFAALLLYNLFAPPEQVTLNQVDERVVEALAAATPAPAYSSLVYQVIQPSLVLIQVQRAHETEDEEEEANGLGSGVVINDSGDILTSLHVITNATEIRLTFADGSESEAVVVAMQPENDIAVLHPRQPPELLVPAVLGNPNAMRVGDEAFAVGHPFGLYGSMSTGVISGFDRTFRPQNSEVRLQGLIQIDAAVNPGNSGGPLLNRYGQVIGIVTGLANPTDNNFFVGIGFAVPINVAGGAAGAPPY